MYGFVCPYCISLYRSSIGVSDETTRLVELTVAQLPTFYYELQQYGLHFGTTRNMARDIIRYVLATKDNYSGTLDEKTEQILDNLEKERGEIFYIGTLFNIPYFRVRAILRNLIRFTLENSE